MRLIYWQGNGVLGFIAPVAASVPRLVLNGEASTGAAVTTTGLASVGSIAFNGGGSGILYLGSNEYPVTLGAMPSLTPYKVASISCVYAQGPAPILPMLRENGVDFAFALGDFPYTDSVKFSILGSPAAADTDGDDTVQNFLNQHANIRGNPWIKTFLAGLPLFYMFDDHEWGGGDWDHTLDHANFNRTSADHANLTDMVTDHWYTGHQAVSAIMKTNPPSPATQAEMPGAIADDITAAANLAGTENTYWPVRYYTFVVGPVTWFVLDTKSYMDPTGVAAGVSTNLSEDTTSGKQMLGANQYTWLTEGLAAAVTPFKGIMTCKQLMTGRPLNSDEWHFFAWQRNALLAYIDANVTGVFFVSGDDHIPAVECGWKNAADHPYGGAVTTYDLASFNACPTSVGSAFSSEKFTGTRSAYQRYRWPEAGDVGFIMHVISDARINFEFRDSRDRIWWSGYQLAGENFIRYDAQLMSVG